MREAQQARVEERPKQGERGPEEEGVPERRTPPDYAGPSSSWPKSSAMGSRPSGAPVKSRESLPFRT